MRYPVILGLAAALAAGPGTAHAQVTPNAVQILQQSVQKERRASYEGLQETTVTTGRRVERTEQIVSHKAPDKHRIEYLAPPRLRGNLLLDDGKNTWQFIRAQNVVERDESFLRAARHLQNQVANAVRRGQARVEYLGEETIAGRKAHGVAVTPVRNPQRRREVWLDKEYGVVLRARDIGPAGGVSDTVFKRIQFNVALDDSDFVWVPRSDVVEVEPGEGRPIPLPRAHQIAVRNWGSLLLPRYLPAGYEFRRAHELRFRGSPVLHLRYSDGTNAFSLFQSVVGNPPRDLPKLRRGPAGRRNNLLPFKRGRINLLLVGPLPLAELQKVADSVP